MTTNSFIQHNTINPEVNTYVELIAVPLHYLFCKNTFVIQDNKQNKIGTHLKRTDFYSFSRLP